MVARGAAWLVAMLRGRLPGCQGGGLVGCYAKARTFWFQNPSPSSMKYLHSKIHTMVVWVKLSFLAL